MLEHGGQLRRAAERFGIAVHDWLDLSTGINPRGWPVPAVESLHWQRLPEAGDGLEAAARDYYECRRILPTAGSQAAIQALPRMCARSQVGVLAPEYSEHAHGWYQAGHEVVRLDHQAIRQPPSSLDVVVLSNPNNPTGHELDRDALLNIRTEMASRDGWLVVDEAFRDNDPAASCMAETDKPGLIVLRSLGKFFGLAGARIGFVAAETGLLERLGEWLGPWPLSGPARIVAQQALRDHEWQQRARAYLERDSMRLAELLTRTGLAPTGGCVLFQWVARNDAESLYVQLARQGVLVRLFTQPAGLRFGLPGHEAGWQRLESVLGQLEMTA